jgi:hypothetical protein
MEFYTGEFYKNKVELFNFRLNWSALSITLRVQLAVFLGASQFCACAERWRILAEHAQRIGISELRMRREVAYLSWACAESWHLWAAHAQRGGMSALRIGSPYHASGATARAEILYFVPKNVIWTSWLCFLCILPKPLWSKETKTGHRL